MQVLDSLKGLYELVDGCRAAGRKIALVPTMGNLHAGHAKLVDVARQLDSLVVASIFVNPTQFGANEDFDRYPRTLDADVSLLREVGADAVFTPAASAMYPDGLNLATRVYISGLADVLCGASRPGHFDGVALVVSKLFNLVQPHVAVFGEKDFQQLAIIRRLVRDLSYRTEIVGVPTVRDADGLALSSRNGYLSADERKVAPGLFAVLTQMRSRLEAGGREFAKIEKEGAKALEGRGFSVDYLRICNPLTLKSSKADDGDYVILVAAYLGRTRLIDNVRFMVGK